MAAFKDQFETRRNNAATAKQALVERFRKRPAEDDPAMVALREERRKIAEARALRDAEREKAKAEALARKAIEEAERIEAEKREAAEAAQRAIELAAAQKAARDARYAARKARK